MRLVEACMVEPWLVELSLVEPWLVEPCLVIHIYIVTCYERRYKRWFA